MGLIELESCHRSRGGAHSMRSLGELERAVMDVLWDSASPMPATSISAQLPNPDLKANTILTVLSRLETKGFVRRIKGNRASQFAPTASRQEHVAEVLRDVLNDSGDPTAALAHFASSVSSEQADILRGALHQRDTPTSSS